MNLLFDIDGTLTEPVQPIGPTIKAKLQSLAFSHNVFLVAGSTHAKVETQLGAEFMDSLTGCFTSSGAEFHAKSSLIYSLKKPQLEDYPALKDVVGDYLAWWKEVNPDNAPTQVEQRPGMLNLCPVGREATTEQRAFFIEQDALLKFRVGLYRDITSLNIPGLTTVVGGQVSLDLYFEGFTGKDYAIHHLVAQNTSGKYIYFGDKMTPQGNDYPAATAILRSNLGAAFSVKSPEETLEYLYDLFPSSASTG